jgi:hypothetical protein
MEDVMFLSPGEYEATVEKLRKINIRAAKRGFNGKLEVIADRVERKSTNALGMEITEIGYETTITGTPPSYQGWRFLATLDWDAEAGLIVRTAPGVDSVNREGLREGWCEHCKTIRNRRKVYLVGSNVDGREIQVGSTCIKDFLGWNATPVFLSSESVQEEIDSYLSGGGYVEQRWTIESVLAAAWAAIQVNGYQPASSYGQTTKGVVLTILNPHTVWDRKLVEEYRPYIEKSAAQAEIIRNWILSDEFKGESDYVLNLKAVASSKTASARNVGLLASAPQTWAKAQERDLIRRKEQGDLVNEFGADPGTKVELKVKVKSIRGIESAWGTSTLYVLEGEDRKVYKWFSTNAALGETADDTTYLIKGTVKKHEEYNGNKSTVLTRCKVI